MSRTSYGANVNKNFAKRYGDDYSMSPKKGYVVGGHHYVYKGPQMGQVSVPVYTRLPEQQAAPTPASTPAPTTAAPNTYEPRPPSGQTTLPTAAAPTINQPQYDPTAMFAQRIAEMQSGMMQALQMQQQQFQQAQQQQNERMEQMMAATMQAQAAAAARPEVASVKIPDSSQGNQMTIAKRGVKGNFNRKGMRIKNINTEQ